MTREEQTETIARSLYNPTIDAERGKINAFIEGAKWSERNLAAKEFKIAAKEFKIAAESYHRSKLVDWQQVRIQAAIAAMQGIMTNYEYIKEFHYSSPNVDAMRKDIAKACRSYADALVKELIGE